MDTAAIIDGLTHCVPLPIAAIEAARAERATVVPEFLRVIEAHLAREGATEAEHASLYLIFHLLGEWRETSAYRPLARLLHRPDIGATLGDAMTETVHQVMAAVFDGDPQPLYDIVLDRKADEFIRSMTFKSLSTLVFVDRLSRAEAARFLAACAPALGSEGKPFAWIGWAEAVATLGLEELVPQVTQAFVADLIDSSYMSREEFDEAFAYARAHAAPDNYWGAKLRLFGDAVAELSEQTTLAEGPREWTKFEDLPGSEAVIKQLGALFRSARNELHLRELDGAAFAIENPSSPFIDPSRSIGRNDPCPCGSGKKYKKCCLN